MADTITDLNGFGLYLGKWIRDCSKLKSVIVSPKDTELPDGHKKPANSFHIGAGFTAGGLVGWLAGKLFGGSPPGGFDKSVGEAINGIGAGASLDVQIVASPQVQACHKNKTSDKDEQCVGWGYLVYINIQGGAAGSGGGIAVSGTPVLGPYNTTWECCACTDAEPVIRTLHEYQAGVSISSINDSSKVHVGYGILAPPCRAVIVNVVPGAPQIAFAPRESQASPCECEDASS